MNNNTTNGNKNTDQKFGRDTTWFTLWTIEQMEQYCHKFNKYVNKT